MGPSSFLLLLLLLPLATPVTPPPRRDADEDASASAWLFADLSPRELRAVRDFLGSRPELGLGRDPRPSPPGRPSLARNSLFLVELEPPPKRAAVRALQSPRGRPLPPRRARAVLFFGAGPSPNVSEYLVGPLPAPTWLRPAGRPLPFASRPVTREEAGLIHARLSELLSPLAGFVAESSGGFALGGRCGTKCLTLTDVAPRGLASGERRSWVMLQRNVDGFYLHPTGLEVLLDHRDLDPRRWSVQRLWYNGKYYLSVDEMASLHARGGIPVVRLPPVGPDGGFASYAPRGEFAHEEDPPAAKTCAPPPPTARAFALRGNRVSYRGWRFSFRLRSSSGPQLLDVRFRGARVAFEVSVQEALAFYGGASPAAMRTRFVDAGWGMGASTHELAPSVDCPPGAAFVDAHHLYDAAGPVRFPRALCLFEAPTEAPLRRHFDPDFSSGAGARFYGGLPGAALLLRASSTVYNYDYLWDFLFHAHGVLEARVSATGYLHAAFFTPDGRRYGSRVHEHLLGNLHTHLVHYKVDLDVAGTENSFETMELGLENIPVPWAPEERLVQPFLERKPRAWEREAAFPVGAPLPRYLLFRNEGQRNRWGHRRSFRLQPFSHAGHILPRGWKEERGVSWSRYHLAVTQQHDSEERSSSIYAQNDPWEPRVSFERFLRNNESIENKDLVAWVTVGFLHIPHAEDIPNTATPGNTAGFFLRPFNFFDEDPSVGSRRTLLVHPDPLAKPPVMRLQRWMPEGPPACAVHHPFSFNGTYRQEEP
ncbi:amiloride-sensitive amine oxidase [copper-containing] [Anolis carolinensis]|uniref:amiloride-sensitive amine oxidase [copper-containing] n=1 Tax=Anolis carolinensis TaxID=28377 RepID=UPI002F2B6300